MGKSYEIAIGLEVHVELSTETKIFCGCSTAFGGVPNTRICPVCTGMPGSLPVLNRKVVEYALALGLATHCQINQSCSFDRKNYFYPDNPQNYQITQRYLPICHHGWLELGTEAGRKTVGVREIHMEEDAGKLVHDEEKDCSLVDYNRAGVPLIEIVTEPDMSSSEEVLACLEELRSTLSYLGVSDCRLQEGSLRVDVNLSVRKTGDAELGTRTEMKNLNSMKAIARAIAHEADRQRRLLEAGEAVVQETRRWTEEEGCSFPMRSKETVQDYRYFPEPDLVPLAISDRWLEEIRGKQPELRAEKLQRYKEEYGIPDYDARILTAAKPMAEVFEKTAALCGAPKQVSNWLMGETLRLQRDHHLEQGDIPFSPENLAKLIAMTEQGILNGTLAKKVFAEVFERDIDPEGYVAEKRLATVRDEQVLRSSVAQVIAENPQSVEDYRGGKARAFRFLMGQAMGAMKGKADPEMVKGLLEELLEKQG